MVTQQLTFLFRVRANSLILTQSYTENLKYELLQQIVETENQINFLLGRYPQPIRRNANSIYQIQLFNKLVGTPAQLLSNRPDIKQAELELQAAKIDIAVARANFYPSLVLDAGIGLNAFNPAFLINPKSLVYGFAGSLAGPLINRKAIKANYYNANERQIQKVINYEQLVLNAFLEVNNQVAGNNNYSASFATKLSQVEILSNSIDISNNLFKSARADYTEVLLTQREALEARMDLMEIKRKQLQSEVNIYKALGGGWR